MSRQEQYQKLLESLYFYMQKNVNQRTRPPKALIELLDSIEKARCEIELDNTEMYLQNDY